jgi:hypothetical protein
MLLITGASFTWRSSSEDGSRLTDDGPDLKLENSPISNWNCERVADRYASLVRAPILNIYKIYTSILK